jgi:hypothetical protein
MEDLGFSYIYKHKAWLHIPTSSLIFIYELDMYSYDEIHALVFERTGVRSEDLQLNPSEWLIEALKMPLYSDI